MFGCRLSISMFVVVAAAGSGGAHTLHLGRACPRVLPFPNLELDKVLGRWRVAVKSDTDNSCLEWELRRGVLMDTFLLTERRQLAVLDSLGVDHTHAVTATLRLHNPEVPARTRIRWPTSLTGEADFTIFDTDYESYMAVFECDRAGLVHRRSLTLLSRTPSLDPLVLERVKRLLDTAEVSSSSLDLISHSACRDTGKINWHVDSELFGFLPGVEEEEVRRRTSQGFLDYDPAQLEIVNDVSSPEDATFRGSMRRTASQRHPRFINN